jgi:hypothetical protein
MTCEYTILQRSLRSSFTVSIGRTSSLLSRCCSGRGKDAGEDDVEDAVEERKVVEYLCPGLSSEHQFPLSLACKPHLVLVKHSTTISALDVTILLVSSSEAYEMPCEWFRRMMNSCSYPIITLPSVRAPGYEMDASVQGAWSDMVQDECIRMYQHPGQERMQVQGVFANSANRTLSCQRNSEILWALPAVQESAHTYSRRASSRYPAVL